MISCSGNEGEGSLFVRAETNNKSFIFLCFQWECIFERERALHLFICSYFVCLSNRASLVSRTARARCGESMRMKNAHKFQRNINNYYSNGFKFTIQRLLATCIDCDRRRREFPFFNCLEMWLELFSDGIFIELSSESSTL